MNDHNDSYNEEIHQKGYLDFNIDQKIEWILNF